MNRLNELVGVWSAWLIHSGWQAAVVVGAVAVLVLLARRRSPQFRYALLMIALVKFAAPPFLSLPTGLFSQTRSPAATFELAIQAAARSDDGNEAAVESPPARRTSGSAAINPPETTSVSSEAAHDSGTAREAALRPEKAVALPKLRSLFIAGLLLHATGVLVAGFFFGRQYRRIRKLVGNSTIAGEWIVHMARQAATELGINRVPAVLVSDESDAPFATGLLRQIILLPRSVLELPTDQLRIILGHELVHIRRRDLAIGWIETALGILWWFHPGMWWLRRELRRTREDCCDDVLLTSRLAQPERYCETLIEAAARQTFVAPEPLALGFSNGEHPTARRIRRLMDSSLFRTGRLQKSSLLLAMVVGCLALPGMQPVRAPVAETSLEGTFGGFRNLPFDPDQTELDIIEECQRVVNQYRSTYDRDGRRTRHFDDPETRVALEAILQRKPDFFYPQHLLGTWYRRNGNPLKGQELLSAALKNAPVVLTQRYRTGGGEPLTSITIESMAIECNRVKDHFLNPELKLEFVDLVPDSRGEVAVPVYDTVFRLYSRSYPEGYETEMQRLGWFSSKSKIGELPEVTAWKRYSHPRDFTRTAAESAWLSDAKGTATGEISSGSNRYRIGRVARCQADGRFTEQTHSNSADLPELPRVTNAGYMDHAIVDLTSPAPDRFEIGGITVLDSRTKIPLTSFQSGAAVKVFDKRRFHLYSLAERLPERVDLLMTVNNYEADSFRMLIPAEAKGEYRKDGVTFVNEYLGAGEHQGWSSTDGFYKEAHLLDSVSEMLYRIDAPDGRRFSLWLVATDGQRIRLDATSPLARIPRPLGEIDHFELAPNVPPETIYFEKIALPPRTDQIGRELPAAEFPLTGKPEIVSTDLFSPIVLRCKTRRGDAYNGSFSGEFGYGFQEQDPEPQDPESKSTVVIEAFAAPGIKLSPGYTSRPDAAELRSAGGLGTSGPWGTAQSSRLSVPLSRLNSVTVRLILDSPTN